MAALKHKDTPKEALYKYIFYDYDQHTILESAVVAIAKKRAKGPFPKALAVKAIVPVVTNARYLYNKTNWRDKRTKLPPLYRKDVEDLARKLYDDEEDHIKRLVSYFKYTNKKSN